MHETRLVVGGNGQGDKNLAIRINGPDPTFRIATETITARLVKPIDDLLLDLLDVAGSVFAADSSIARGSKTHADFGAHWRRSLDFTIPVRCPDIWSKPEVADSLKQAAQFLSDDRFEFTFVAGQPSGQPQQYLNFDEHGDQTGVIEEVILFSGGLDSLAGAVERLSTGSGRVALVTHVSAQKILSHQSRLAKALQTRFPGRVLHIPITARRTKSVAKDSNQRSRSLLFAAFGYVIARMLGARNISFYENGIVSQNLPINSQIVGTMATRTTHPLSLLKLNAFLCALDGEPVRIANHFSNLTKTDVVQKIAKHNCADLIKDAISCTSVRSQDIVHTHCGACSQCLDRRFAILAANLQDHEFDYMYETDVLLGARSTDRSRIMALDWTSHTCRMAEANPSQFYKEHLGVLTRLIEGTPDASQLAVVNAVFELQKRQGQIVQEVLRGALVSFAQELLNKSLPETSLLRMYIAQQAQGGHRLPSALRRSATLLAEERGAISEAEPAESFETIFPLQVAFDSVNEDYRIQIKGLGAVRGGPAEVVHALKVPFDEDVANGLTLDAHRYVQPHLVTDFEIPSKDAARQLVRRCRAELAEFYVAIEGGPPPAPLLIESSRGRGYRLDPTCKIISPDALS